MTIKVGDRLPEASFQVLKNGVVHDLASEAVFAGRNVVLFAVPGAFTPICDTAHLPGYVVYSERFRDKGIDALVCLSVNDAFVMGAWQSRSDAENILMLADGSASFTRKIGMESETSAFGVRSRRYSMFVKDGEVCILNIDDQDMLEISDAETMLSQL